MPICEKCGEEFKPYWNFTDIQNKKCEKCAYLESEEKERRIWNALIKIMIGFLIVIINPESTCVPLEVIGFILILFGTIKLIEDAIMHKGVYLETSKK
ncbi:MAG: hypothetical protein DRG25_05655 [Deltaproteobacteria bacterium]|nr:MAG: hypothetical protein DRG25_05655 [Deltaproteobacteria bacterium]